MKTQISLGIRTQQRLWSDWVESSLGAPPLCWFCHVVAQDDDYSDYRASTWDYGTYHIDDQWRLSRACASSFSLFADMKYGSRWRVLPKIRHLALLDGCACGLRNEFMENEKYHNLMSWLYRYAGWSEYSLGPRAILYVLLCPGSYGPRRANLVLIAYASSEGSGEPAHPRSLARTSAARSYKQWVKRNFQTESLIPVPSEWLGMRS